MRYYAIARLENNGNKGFRIYDDISKGCKDVPLENIENLINNELVNIANLKIHRGKLIGYGGNLEDLGLIVNNVVVKNSYILMAIVEEKYSLIDVNGNITTLESDSVEKLILNNLVFNAKNKYNRQGIKHGITYKEVEFNTIKYINIAERKDTGKYIGDKVEGRILANVLMNSNINKESKIKYNNIII